MLDLWFILTLLVPFFYVLLNAYINLSLDYKKHQQQQSKPSSGVQRKIKSPIKVAVSELDTR